MKNKAVIFMAGIMGLNLILTLIGINWGLPDRWCVDEQVSNSLKLLASGSIFTVVTNVHPQLYNLFLGALFIPYIAFNKIIGFPLQDAVSMAGISWMELAHNYPGFAGQLYLIARVSSVALGILTLYLLYRITKIIHGKKPALFASLTLGVSLGFVETNHLAKHTSLVVFLVLLVFFFCIKAVSSPAHMRRYIYLASFACGLAATAKLDGIISSLFIVGAVMHLFFQKMDVGQKLILSSALLFGAGIIIGCPAILVNFDKYYQTRHTHNGIFYGGFHMPSLAYFFAIADKLKDGIILLVRNFSLPLSLFVFCGIADFLRNIRKYPYSAVISTMLIPYIFICLAYFTEYPGISTKLIVHAIIIFSLFSGKAIADFLSEQKRYPALRRAVVLSVFFFAAYYTFQADLFFVGKDTRYHSTRWILQNIPKGSAIEHYQEGENLFSTSKIPYEYDVVFWGRHSYDYRSKKSLYLRNVREKLTYREKLNSAGSKADFFMLAVGTEFVMDEPPQSTFMRRLYDGVEPGFELIKVFEAKENYFLMPRPEWSSPRILLYGRIKK